MKRLTMEYGDKRVSLLPCRFCGSDPIIHSYRRRGLNYSIRCGNQFGVCRMRPQTLNYPELEQAVADWNMMPPEPNDPLTLEELREMAKRKPVVVWMVHLDEDGQDYGEWAMFLSEENMFIGDGTCWGTKNYGTAFVAYLYKPKKETT